MAATLTVLRTLQDEILANSKVNNYTEDERVQALNDARLEVLEYARWPQLKVSATVSFISGVGSLPTDFFYDEEDLYEPNTDGTRKNEYNKIDPSEFIKNISKTYSIIDNSGTAKLQIFEADTISLTFWYIKQPWSADMSAGGDTTGFSDSFNRVIARLSVAYLISYKNASNTKPSVIKYGQGGNESQPKDGSVYKLLSKLFAQYKKRYSPRGRKINSYYSSKSFY